MTDVDYGHKADGEERAWRVWAQLLGTGWILASFAYSKPEHAQKHRDYLARTADASSWLAHEVREETPQKGFIIIDDIDGLMKAAETKDWSFI